MIPGAVGVPTAAPGTSRGKRFLTHAWISVTSRAIGLLPAIWQCQRAKLVVPTTTTDKTCRTGRRQPHHLRLHRLGHGWLASFASRSKNVGVARLIQRAPARQVPAGKRGEIVAYQDSIPAATDRLPVGAGQPLLVELHSLRRAQRWLTTRAYLPDLERVTPLRGPGDNNRTCWLPPAPGCDAAVPAQASPGSSRATT